MMACWGRDLRDQRPQRARLVRAAVGMVLVGVGLVSLGAATPALAAECPAQGDPRIISRAVPGSGIPRLEVVGTIAAKPDSVWQIVTDCNGYKRSMPRIVRSRELSRSAGKVRCQTEVGMPFPFSNLHSESENNAQITPGRWQMDFHQVKGDYRINEGSWVLQPCGADGASTVVTYTVHAVTQTVVPDAIVRRGMRSAMFEMFRKITALVAR